MTGDDLHRDGQQKLPRVLRVYEKRNELMLHKKKFINQIYKQQHTLEEIFVPVQGKLFCCTPLCPLMLLTIQAMLSAS